jgi:hypothetical protein
MFRASAVRMSACTAVVALGLWQAATSAVPASAAAPSAQPSWIITQTAVGLLGPAGLTKAQLQILFGNDRTYLTGGLAPATPPVSGALRTVSFASYQAMERQLAGPGLPAGTAAVIYDNEDWRFTPAAERRDPAMYQELAAKLAHAHHLLFISTPAVDLTNVLAPGQSDHYAAYLRLGLAASAARYADVVDIQAQGSETSLSTFTPFVEAAAAQARSANPHVIVLAGISTNPSGQHVSSTQFTSAYNAVRADVDGYWLNIPSSGPECPACGTPQPKAAVPLLRMLARSVA